MELLTDAANRAANYLANINHRGVAPTPEAVDLLQTLDERMPSKGIDPTTMIAELDAVAGPATVATSGGRYFGFVIGGAHPAGVAASILAAAWDQNAGLAVTSPAAAALDAIALRWIADLLGLPSGSEGVFVTGASMANTTALAAARDDVLTRFGWSVADDGLNGAPPLTVVVGGEVHATVLKSLRTLGIGRSSLVELPSDDQGAIIASDLPKLSGPAIVITQAGNVNSGAFDPFPPLVEWAREADAWIHVDGAFGLWAAACSELRPLTSGAELADSWAIDCHKWLNTPYDSAITFVRDASALHRTFGIDAAYIPSSLARDAARLGPSFSQRARGVEAYAVLRCLGREGVDDLLERTCRFARKVANAFTEAGHTVLNDVVLNQVVVTFGEATGEVIDAVQQDGTCWCGGTTWQGQPAMRFSVSSWATSEADIDLSIRVILDLAATTLSRYE
jgi:glutamate/tyrosine decarboxylase-like PLP-dependent enzyme